MKASTIFVIIAAIACISGISAVNVNGGISPVRRNRDARTTAIEVSWLMHIQTEVCLLYGSIYHHRNGRCILTNIVQRLTVQVGVI